MDISELTLRIVIIFIPGFIAFQVVDKLTLHRKAEMPDVLLNSLTLGFVCYYTYYLFTYLITRIPFLAKSNLGFTFTQILFDETKALDFNEILLTTAMAIPIGLATAYILNHRLLYRLSKALKISRKSDDIGVWHEIFSSKQGRWVVIRNDDYGENDLVYEGFVDLFSEGLEQNELLLRDVRIYRRDPESKSLNVIHETPSLYMSLGKENIKIEFPNPEPEPDLECSKEATRDESNNKTEVSKKTVQNKIDQP